MSHVSGVGYYTTTFDLPAWEADGAYLQLTSTSGGTAAVYVNGEKAPPLDLRTLRVDISGLLKPGENVIAIDVATTLTNRLLQRGYSGARWVGRIRGVQDYGLIGEIAIVPFVEEAVNVSVGVYADEKTHFGGKVEYTANAGDMKAVNLVELTFNVDGNILTGSNAILSGLNGFALFGDLVWTHLGDNLWQASAVLGTFSGVTKTGSMDIGNLVLDSVKLGNAEVTLVKAVFFGIDIVDGVAQSNERAAFIDPASATTKVYSVYDVDDDGEVGWADLSLAFFYYQSKLGDSNWDNAKAADVNGDGVVDMVDLVAIYANFIAK